MRDKATKLLKCLRRKEENSKERQPLTMSIIPEDDSQLLQTWENGKRGKCRWFETMNNIRYSQKSMTGAMSKQTHQVGLIIQCAPPQRTLRGRITDPCSFGKEKWQHGHLNHSSLWRSVPHSDGSLPGKTSKCCINQKPKLQEVTGLMQVSYEADKLI